MVLPGISNSNEFYSAYYLETKLLEELKKINKRLTEIVNSQVKLNSPEDLINNPSKSLKKLRKSWQKLREAERSLKKDSKERLLLQRELFFKPLCEVLGYEFIAKAEPVLASGEAYQIPLIGEVKDLKGEPSLWLLECFNSSDENVDPLELNIANAHNCQVSDSSLGYVYDMETWEMIISERIFGQDSPPRWLIAVSRDQILLIDRQKWNASRLLRFDLEILFGDNNSEVLLAALTLLHREHTCPLKGGTGYLDELDENSHKHAYEVSSDLKYALRKSIELIGNEAIHCLKSRNEGVFKGKIDAEQLTIECLRYMYRLLFLFYIESRPELGYSPMGSDIYRLGYSLESLRDMDNTELVNEEDKESTFISDSLDRLFQMIWEGYPKRKDPTEQLFLREEEDTFYESFRLTPLRTHLFDPERLPILTRIRFRNVVLREVVELMSLTKAVKGKRRGRVSYSQLGINQLGAVYETLLSFRGFFAEENLFEVQEEAKKNRSIYLTKDDELSGNNFSINGTKVNGSPPDELEVGHFVTSEQLKAYNPAEIVPDPETGYPKYYPKGSFIYRLAGRDRQKSASYYTPESLTQCLVNFSLKELLPGKTAAEILTLKVCEPAMGSAAFLNEVVNQLANAYLELRQKEMQKKIPHEQFSTELQKVKMRLADQNVFGVDLNPIAVELAEVSLWLNSIFTPEKGRAFVPWFSQQLMCGNSLIGARREIYRTSQLLTKRVSLKFLKKWYEYSPDKMDWNQELPEDGIYHFLLPNPGMASYSDKVIKELEPEAIEYCKKWNKVFVEDFFTETQISHLKRLSKLVDSLWKEWINKQERLRERTTDPLPVWEDPTGVSDGAWTSLKLKDRIQEQEVQGRDVANTNARLRLKWAMDYWSALWFWPLSEFRLLPTRDEFLIELSMILGDLEQGISPELGQINLFTEDKPKQIAVDFNDKHGFVNVNKLKNEFKRLQIVEKIIERIKPLHWDLEFADLMSKGGFDLTIGNPPWSKAEWKEQNFIQDFDPIVKFRKLSASQSSKKRYKLLQEHDIRKKYFLEFEQNSGTREFITSKSLYNEISGQVNNISKNFIFLGIRITSKKGILALIHPPSIYDDSSGDNARLNLYPRLRKLFHFRNELLLFDIMNTVYFVLSIYGESKPKIYFEAIFKLLHPKTIMQCYENDLNNSIIPRPKNESGKWNLTGHSKRIIKIDVESLKECAKATSAPIDKYLGTRLIQHYTENSIQLTKILFAQNKVLGGDFDSLRISNGLNESSTQKSGLIKRSSEFSSESSLLILAGSNIHICNPIYKSAKEVCTHPKHYYPIINLAEEYLIPRTVYQQIINKNKILEQDKLCLNYKISIPRQIDPGSERSLQPCMLPPSWTHIDGIISFSTNDIFFDLEICGLFSSIVMDYFVKASGKSNFLKNVITSMPMPTDKEGFLAQLLIARVLVLNSRNSLYYDLLELLKIELVNKKIIKGNSHDEFLRWLTKLGISKEMGWHLLSGKKGQFFYGSDFNRAKALAEIDVLTAKLFSIPKNLFLDIFDEGFQISQTYDSNTFYDNNGQIIFTNNKGLAGIGLPRFSEGYQENKRIGWEEIKYSQTGSFYSEIIYNANSKGPEKLKFCFEAPFKKFERKKYYQTFWNDLENKIKK